MGEDDPLVGVGQPPGQEVVVERHDERFHRQHEAEQYQREQQPVAHDAQHAERVPAQDGHQGPDDHDAAGDDQARLQVLAEPGLSPRGGEVRPLQVREVDRAGRARAEGVEQHPHQGKEHPGRHQREQDVVEDAFSARDHSGLPSATLTMIRTIRSDTADITTPMAAADPMSGLANARSYSTTVGVIVEMPGPPLVVSQTRSNSRIAPSTVSVSTTASGPRRPGSVTVKNSRTGPAPSTRAASYSSAGMPCMPARNSTMHSPNAAHVPIRPIAGSPHV